MKLTKYQHAIIFFSLIWLAFQQITEIVQNYLSLVCHRIFISFLPFFLLGFCFKKQSGNEIFQSSLLNCQPSTLPQADKICNKSTSRFSLPAQAPTPNRSSTIFIPVRIPLRDILCALP